MAAAASLVSGTDQYHACIGRGMEDFNWPEERGGHSETAGEYLAGAWVLCSDPRPVRSSISTGSNRSQTETAGEWETALPPSPSLID